jgi:hypothetical protein
VSHRLLLCVSAAVSALITAQATAEPRHQSGNWSTQKAYTKGFHAGAKHHDGARGAHRRGHRFGSAWGWPGYYALPESEYSDSTGTPSAATAYDDYRCEYADCIFSYHPFGFYDIRPKGGDDASIYMIAPDAKIISIDQVGTNRR